MGPRASVGGSRLWREARRLEKVRGPAKAPVVFFFTDPDRGPDPEEVLKGLPTGAGVVFRTFGRPDAEALGRRLRALARRRRLLFLVGADEKLAARLKADGLHLPERLLRAAPRLRARRPLWVVTGAAHSGQALRRARRLDAAFLSPAFPTRSPGPRAGGPRRDLGPVRFALLVRGAASPAYALGGVTGARLRRLVPGSALGVGAVEAFGPLG